MKKPHDAKKSPGPGKGPKGKGPANPNPAAQTRKVLGKHYAAKYGVSKERG